MAIRFNIRPKPGAKEAARRELEDARRRVHKELWLAVDELHKARRSGNESRIHELTHQVLPALWLRVRVVGINEVPERLTSPLKVGKVRWAGEEALRHLESLGFRKPGSKQQLPKRVHAFVRKLILDGKGDSLPEHLFDIPLSLIIDTY